VTEGVKEKRKCFLLIGLVNKRDGSTSLVVPVSLSVCKGRVVNQAPLINCN
jgi:metallophosphoesterase superfamily enzyme